MAFQTPGTFAHGLDAQIFFFTCIAFTLDEINFAEDLDAARPPRIDRC